MAKTFLLAVILKSSIKFLCQNPEKIYILNISFTLLRFNELAAGTFLSRVPSKLTKSLLSASLDLVWHPLYIVYVLHSESATPNTEMIDSWLLQDNLFSRPFSTQPPCAPICIVSNMNWHISLWKVRWTWIVASKNQWW